ncbi:MAG: hypothetical protein CMH49_01665 [Myxococcales bacterium]|nr:hypothetical protein [Myxococcales bacterium]
MKRSLFPFIVLKHFFSCLLCFAIGVLTSACEMENTIDDSPNVLPTAAGQMAGADIVEGGAEAGEDGSGDSNESQCANCAQIGTWYRFSNLGLDAIDGRPHPVVAVLNSLWSADVDSHSLNVLFEIRAVDGEQITMGAMNAAWVSEAENDYCVMPETAIEFIFTQSECSMSNSVPAGINIYAGSQEIPKNCSPQGEAVNAIPVRDVLLSAEFTSDCGSIVNGTVRSAAIKRSALEGTCSCLSPVLGSCEGLNPSFEGNNFGECGGCNQRYSSLSRQLNSIQELTWECEVDGEQSACIEAHFEASRLDFTPPQCP